MKRWLAAFIFSAIVSTGALAAAKGPEVDFVDNRLSINAEAISIGRLLQLVDLATGMKSKVPAELANRNLSVKFSGLNLTDAVRKMFQGQPLDYVVIQGQSIIVTAASQTVTGGESLPFVPQNSQPIDQPFVQEFPTPGFLPGQGQAFPGQQLPGQPQQQPAMVQTPFGPIANPRAQQPQPNAPLNAPGQQNSLFPQTSQPANQQPVPGFPGNQPNTTNPFGTVSPFGSANPPTGNPGGGLFGSPPVTVQPGTQR